MTKTKFVEYYTPKFSAIIHGLKYIIDHYGEPVGENKSVGLHKLMKVLFYADVEAVNSSKNFYQPIFGGSYLAMPYGPVHKEVYEIIQSDTLENILPSGVTSFLAVDKIGISRNGNFISYKDYNKKDGSNEPDYDFLSTNAIDFIGSSWQELKDLSFIEITIKSHQHKAWLNARKKKKGGNAPLMDYIDFFEDEETIKSAQSCLPAYAVA